jgi:hypothetical protein
MYIVYQCLGSISFLCRSGSWIRPEKKWIRIQVLNISLRFTIFLNRWKCPKFVLFFDYFLAETWWTIQKFGNYKLTIMICVLKIEGNIFSFGWYFALWIRIHGSAFCKEIQRNWVFVTNSNLLIPISLQPEGANYWYFKLRLFYL